MPHRVRRAAQELRTSVRGAAPVAGGGQPLPQAGIPKNGRRTKRAPRLIGALFCLYNLVRFICSVGGALFCVLPVSLSRQKKFFYRLCSGYNIRSSCVQSPLPQFDVLSFILCRCGAFPSIFWRIPRGNCISILRRCSGRNYRSRGTFQTLRGSLPPGPCLQ